MIRVRVKATGQVVEMMPGIARAMIANGFAEEVKDKPTLQKEVAARVIEGYERTANFVSRFYRMA